jgi:DoxX-like family
MADRAYTTPLVREDGDASPRMRPILNYGLWTVQGLLALLFLWAGGIKLVLPLEQLAGPISLPGMFLRFIGVCEVLGALGLILPGLLRLWPGLTPLAAAGLVIIMSGATVLTLVGGDVVMALMPLVVGLLAAFVAYGRWSSFSFYRRRS